MPTPSRDLSITEIQKEILDRAPFLSRIGMATGTLQCKYCLVQWCIIWVSSDHAEFRLQGYESHRHDCPVRDVYPPEPGIDVTDLSDIGMVINAVSFNNEQKAIDAAFEVSNPADLGFVPE